MSLVLDNKINRFSIGTPIPNRADRKEPHFQAHVLPVIYGDIATHCYTCILADTTRDFKSLFPCRK